MNKAEESCAKAWDKWWHGIGPTGEFAARLGPILDALKELHFKAFEAGWASHKQQKETESDG